jgi:SprT-like family
MLNSAAIAATAITPIEYCGLQQAYDHFNFELFDGKLPDVMITLQHRANSYGHFSPDRLSGRAGNLVKHELNLNPDGFRDRSDEQICSTLAHEMVHAWQEVFGKPSKGGYHNREWAEQMKAIGLQPSASGLPGGNETGPQVSHYILADGRFARAYSTLATTGWKLNLESGCE